MVSITADGKNIYDGSVLVVKTTEPAEEAVNGSSKIIELQKDKRGKVNGFILENKTILRVSAKISEQLEKIVKISDVISYSGAKKHLHNGEVAAETYTIIHCKTITINGKEYLTK